MRPDNQEPDWGANERFEQAWDKIQEVIERNSARPSFRTRVKVSNLKPGTRLDVIIEPDPDELDTRLGTAHPPAVVEITIQNPTTGDALIRDQFNFPTPTPVVLTGSKEGTLFRPGELVPYGTFTIEVNGQPFIPTGPEYIGHRMTLTSPNGGSIVLWETEM